MSAWIFRPHLPFVLNFMRDTKKMAQYFLEEMDKESLNLAWFSGINMED
jgi:hypothetical protein